MAFQGIRKMPLRVFLQCESPKPFSQKSLIFPLGPPFSFALTSNEIPPYKELALKEYHHKEHILRIPETTKSLKVLSLEYIADTYFYQVLKEYHHKEHILRIPETTKSLKVLPLEYISDTYFYQVRRSLVKSREILTTSDANSKNARLVVPKKCAQVSPLHSELCILSNRSGRKVGVGSEKVACNFRVQNDVPKQVCLPFKTIVNLLLSMDMPLKPV
ncbi:hypothetical protein Q3G72_004554 [Acer saccharum]|nr:hypothetical protein Q3G72_004554 [Acer saccharum]